MAFTLSREEEMIFRELEALSGDLNQIAVQHYEEMEGNNGKA